MKGEIKGYGRRTKQGGTDARDRCGKLTLAAETEADAALLALLGRLLFNTCVKPGDQRMELYAWMRERVDDQDTFPTIGRGHAGNEL